MMVKGTTGATGFLEARPALELLERRFQLSVSLTLSGTQTINVADETNASGTEDTWESEMSISVNPTDPLNLAGLSHRFTNISGSVQEKLYFYRSTDGGATWSKTEIDNDDDGKGSGNRFDPAVAFADDGRLFIAYGVSGNDDISAQEGEIDTLDGGSGYDTSLVDYDVFTWVFDEDLNIEVIVY